MKPVYLYAFTGSDVRDTFTQKGKRKIAFEKTEFMSAFKQFA